MTKQIEVEVRGKIERKDFENVLETLRENAEFRKENVGRFF